MKSVFSTCIAILLLLPSGQAFGGPLTLKPAASPQEIKPIRAGDKAPDVALLDIMGDTVNLLAAGRENPMILIFYRGGWCPYCNAQLAKLGASEDSLRGLGYRIYAVSPDLPAFLKESKEKHGLKFDFLSDSKSEAALAFGIAFQLDAKTVDKYRQWNMDLEKHSGNMAHILPVPAVFLIDKAGVIRYSYANPDYKVRLDLDTLLSEARKFAP